MTDPVVNDRDDASKPDASTGPTSAGSQPSAKPAQPASAQPDGTEGADPTKPRRRRGSRGGRGRNRSGQGNSGQSGNGGKPTADKPTADKPAADKPTADKSTAEKSGGGRGSGRSSSARDKMPDELPERANEGRPKSAEAADRALVRKPQIGDTRPAPVEPAEEPKTKPRRRRGGRGRGSGNSGGRGSTAAPVTPVEAIRGGDPLELDDEVLEKRRGRHRKGRPVGRYLMVVSKREQATQMAVLEGRNLIEHYVSRPADDVGQIHGNIYLGKVQNVLPGMEAAFVDIGTPKNAVLYRGDVQYDAEDIEEKSAARIEHILKPKQSIVCQVTKNPIAHKGARLTQEVSLPGRFVVLIPNSKTYGISKRLPDDERRRLRQILDRAKPAEHGIIVRTAAEGVTSEEIEADVRRLLDQWAQIDALAKKANAPALLYREPDMAVRVIREEFSEDYRGIVIDDRELYDDIHGYVMSISPALADRVQFYDKENEPLSVFERNHVHEQLHKALDRKVWLPSGGSLIIEHTEALTVIDVNTGKNVGSSSLEETVYRNNLEAAVEIAKQLRLRDIGGIIVCDFIDMEIRDNRDEVIKTFRESLARDKTRTQVFDISELGLVEMTRKRIGEGLLESFSSLCPECEGRGLLIESALLD